MIIDQWGFYDPGYFPEDINDLELIDLAKNPIHFYSKMTSEWPYFRKRGIISPGFTCFRIKNSTFDLVLAGFCFLVFAIIAYLTGIDMMELFILLQTHSINPITAFQYRFQAKHSS